MTINREKIKNIFRWRNVRKVCFDFLEKKAGWILFILIFALSGYGVYLWYNYIYHPEWNEEKKKEYREEKGKGVDFDKDKFNEALKNYNSRGDNYNKKTEDQKDIFRVNDMSSGN
ncbi:MAG: hypothetical protein WCV59_04595 [Parcubacteria group bacterium]|jgi:hypothetical protein